MEIDNLRNYVSEACPTVNSLLRCNEEASSYAFDSLFIEGTVPSPLYRLIDNENINIQDGIFTDPGYLSCSDSIDSFIAHVSGSEVACLQFNIPAVFNRVDIRSLIPEHTDEGEIILPRGLRFRVDHVRRYSTREEIQEFLEMVQSDSSVGEICEIYKIQAIHFYKLTLAVNFRKYVLLSS